MGATHRTAAFDQCQLSDLSADGRIVVDLAASAISLRADQLTMRLDIQNG